VAKQKATPEMWSRARREWETSASVSYADIASKYLISKALVGQEAKRAGWVKGIGVVANASKEDASKRIDNLQNPQQPATRAPVLDDSRPSSVASDSEASRRVDVASAEAMANRAAPTHDDIKIPDGLDAWGREDFVKAAIVQRQKTINALQSKELAAVKQKLYNSIKQASTAQGPALALAVERNVRSLVAMHDAEMEPEISRVRLDLAEFAGQPVRPVPARIVVHMVPGRQLASSDGRVVDVDSREIGRE